MNTQKTVCNVSQAESVPHEVLIKNPSENNVVFLLVPLPQNILSILRDLYEENDILPEPFIEREHCTTSSVYDTFREMAQVPLFISRTLYHRSGLVPRTR